MKAGSTGRGIASELRGAATLSNAMMVLVGVVAGYSASIVSADVVALPLVGAVPGLLVGGIGLAGSFAVYRTVGCCGDCGGRTFGLSGGCDCSGEREDSCSVDP